jgi:hypothetical protein
MKPTTIISYLLNVLPYIIGAIYIAFLHTKYKHPLGMDPVLIGIPVSVIFCFTIYLYTRTKKSNVGEATILHGIIIIAMIAFLYGTLTFRTNENGDVYIVEDTLYGRRMTDPENPAHPVRAIPFVSTIVRIPSNYQLKTAANYDVVIGNGHAHVDFTTELHIHLNDQAIAHLLRKTDDMPISSIPAYISDTTAKIAQFAIQHGGSATFPEGSHGTHTH